MYLIIIFLIKLINATIIGRVFGIDKIKIITFLTGFIGIGLRRINFLSSNSFGHIILWEWLTVNTYVINIEFEISRLTTFITLVIVTISRCIRRYSSEYIREDPGLKRFLRFIELFTVCILIIVNSGNRLVFFVGWEGVGIRSFLLISFWWTRIQAVKAALIAIIINKIGDRRLLIRIGYVYGIFGTVDFDLVLVLTSFRNNSLEVKIIACLVVLRAIRKSAQFGFHSWLTNAIEGPTPVSALLHAATIVTAGVFLLVRFSKLLVLSNEIIFILVRVGLITMFISSRFATVEYDLKKIIALSTCAHLGIIVLFCGLGQFTIRIYHFRIHAFHKAVLFIGRGAVIHIIKDEQDTRKMVALKIFIPFVYVAINLSALALLGFPFFAGIYTKERLVFILFSNNTNSLRAVVICVILRSSILFIVSYTYKRLKIFHTCPYLPMVSRVQYRKLKATPLTYVYSILAVSIGGIWCRWLSYDIFVIRSEFFFREVVSNTKELLIIEFLPWYRKILPWRFVLGGTISFQHVYIDKARYNKGWLNKRWLNSFISNCIFKSSKSRENMFEKGWFERLLKFFKKGVFVLQQTVSTIFQNIAIPMRIIGGWWRRCIMRVYYRSLNENREYVYRIRLIQYTSLNRIVAVPEEQFSKVPVVIQYRNRIRLFIKKIHARSCDSVAQRYWLADKLYDWRHNFRGAKNDVLYELRVEEWVDRRDHLDDFLWGPLIFVNTEVKYFCGIRISTRKTRKRKELGDIRYIWFNFCESYWGLGRLSIHLRWALRSISNLTIRWWDTVATEEFFDGEDIVIISHKEREFLMWYEEWLELFVTLVHYRYTSYGEEAVKKLRKNIKFFIMIEKMEKGLDIDYVFIDYRDRICLTWRWYNVRSPVRAELRQLVSIVFDTYKNSHKIEVALGSKRQFVPIYHLLHDRSLRVADTVSIAEAVKSVQFWSGLTDEVRYKRCLYEDFEYLKKEVPSDSVIFKGILKRTDEFSRTFG